MGWELSEAQWEKMSPEQQLRHRVSVRAYFLGEERLKNGTPGNMEQDWLQAEAIEKNRDDLDRLWRDLSGEINRAQKALKTAIYYVATRYKIPVASIKDDTLLPGFSHDKQRICDDVVQSLVAEPLALPENIHCIRELVVFVVANYRQKRPHQHLSRPRW